MGTGSSVDDILLAALRGPLVLWTTMLGVYLATELAQLPTNLRLVLSRLLVVLLIVSVTWSLSRVAFAVVANRAQALGRPPAVALISNGVRLLVLMLGGLVVLQTLGVSITPLITALGVGGLAAGLALQDTLANLFAGIHILAARQVRRGDFVRLESGDQGHVEDITWRYTTVRQLANYVTIVPNAKLASAIVTNYSLPNPELAVLVPLAVTQDSDLERVEAIAVEVAKETMRRVQGAAGDFEPFMRYDRFGAMGIDCTVVLRAKEFVDQYLLRHEFIKRLHQRFQSEGIEIPAAPRMPPPAAPPKPQ
jgi:small-conductance mechanosensitive channel